MRTAWELETDDFVRLRDYGGQRFVQMMNALLRAESSASHVPAAAVHLNEAITVPDGGVDALVDRPLRQPFSDVVVGTFWQFKGGTAKEVALGKLRKELKKPEVAHQLRGGRLYVVCVCDDLTPQKLRKLEEALAKEVQQAHPNAPQPRILSIGQLITWLGDHPGVVAAHLRLDLQGVTGHALWLERQRALLPTYVTLTSRAELVGELQAFANRVEKGPAVFAVAGDSGTGVTRLVAEATAEVAAKTVLVEAEEAVRVAAALSARRDAHVLIIVDRCSIALRIRLEEVLGASSDRVRALVIHEPSEPVEGARRVTAPVNQEVDQILQANFSNLSHEERRAIVHVADGLVAIGAHLALAARGGASGWLHRSDAWAGDQLTALVKDPQDARVLRMLALFRRVGFAGEIKGEVEQAASLFGLDVHDVRVRTRRLAKSGLITIGPRYVAVRPRLFAKVCFANAWDESIAGRYETVRQALPEPLRTSFLQQAGRFAPENARQTIGRFELRELGELAQTDLWRSGPAQRLLLLLDVAPQQVVPLLAELVARMTEEERLTTGDRLQHWDARHHWIRAFCERMGTTDSYALAENTLFKLARAERPPDADRSHGRGQATEAWLNSFPIFLSGTPLPYPARARRLALKLELDTETAPWIIVAATRALDPHASKTVGDPVVAGEARKEDWQPRTYDEWRQCREQALDLLAACLRLPTHRKQALRVFARFGWALLQQGHLETLSAVLREAGLDAAERSAIRHFIEQYLTHDSGSTPPPGVDFANYLKSVRSWHTELRPADYQQRLLEALQARAPGAGDSLAALGAEFFAQDFLLITAALQAEGKHCYLLYDFGGTIGKQDESAVLLEQMLSPARELPTLLVRGYVSGLALRQTHDATVREALDVLEHEKPLLCLDLAACHPRVGDISERALRLVRAAVLPLKTLSSVHAIRFQGQRLNEALAEVLRQATDSRDGVAATALTLCERWAYGDADLPGDATTLNQVWQILELAGAGEETHAHIWGSLLARVAPSDVRRAAELACRTAEGGEYTIANQARSVLTTLLANHGESVFEIMGATLISTEAAGAGLSKTVALLHSVEDEVLFVWLAANGILAARLIAYHLPEPYMDKHGQLVIGPRTERFLRQYGDDEKVIRNFCNPPLRGGLYAGDIAMRHDQEADRARPFLNHEHRAVRRWAEREVESGEHSARWWREHEEECDD
ncbi:MAG: hypothetical protein JWN04_4445 [Myxococcaceae bacterium]|nr:hypothetical protein [Myxococcaceae bacterium]